MTTARRRPRLVVEDVSAAAAAIRAAGGRLTPARRAVLEALFAADAPVSAEHVAGGLDGRAKPMDLTSAYRNLEWLEELGLVSHIHAGHGAGLYELAGGSPRDYLVCERCGSVTAIDGAALGRARTAIKRATGFEARFDHFPVHGFCERCAGRA